MVETKFGRRADGVLIILNCLKLPFCIPTSLLQRLLSRIDNIYFTPVDHICKHKP